MNLNASFSCKNCKHDEKAHTYGSCFGCLQFAYTSFQVCTAFVPDNLAYLERKVFEKELKGYTGKIK